MINKGLIKTYFVIISGVFSPVLADLFLGSMKLIGQNVKSNKNLNIYDNMKIIISLLLQ